MDGWELFYGALTIGTVSLSLLTRCPGVRRAAGFIFVVWALYVVLQRLLQPHTLALIFSHIDAVAIIFGLTLKGRNGRKRHSPYVGWIWAFIACHVADMLVHLWFLFMPFERNFTYYVTLNGIYVIVLASICTPSVGYYWRMWKRHRRRPAVVVGDAACQMRRGYCGRCGPLGVHCQVTGRKTG